MDFFLFLGHGDTSLMPPPAQPLENAGYPKPKRRLDTPLAAMLPSKYENTDVTELFPDFRHDKVNKLTKLFHCNHNSFINILIYILGVTIFKTFWPRKT